MIITLITKITKTKIIRIPPQISYKITMAFIMVSVPVNSLQCKENSNYYNDNDDDKVEIIKTTATRNWNTERPRNKELGRRLNI